jgi:hypothetical protein
MNSLVKFLIQPLLESNQGGIALVPGGFKPPTLGHFSLVDEVAKHPEVSKVIVLIGHKTRDGVTKEESKEIWDIYQKYLPSNVEIKLADNSSPVSDVGSMIKNNPDTMFYPVVGIRGEMDLGDLKRFDSMKGKYENFKPIVIKSEGEDRISGTNTRAALIGGDKDKFLTYLPTELSNEDKEKVWNILTKTPLDESVIGDKVKIFFNNFKSAYKGQKEDFKGFGPLVKKYLSKEQLTDEEKVKLERNFKDILKISGLSITFPIMGVSGTALLRFLINKISKGNIDILPSSFKSQVINEFITKFSIQEFVTQSELDSVERIADEWFEDYGIDVQFTRHFIERVNDERNGKPISAEELEDLFTQTAEKYGEKLANLPDDYQAVLFKLRNDINLPFALNYDDKNDEIDLVAKTVMRKKNFQTSNPKLALEEVMYAEPSENDYPILMKSLTEYMLDKGMNIRPLPKVKFVDDDVENAKSFFGKTAYYDPNNRVIVLYTMNRHPKDVMRSFAHEMIHHMQNCDDRLGNIQTQDTNEDGDLPEIEREAYEKGNMTFRNWTDTLTEGVFKKSLDQTEKEALKIVDKNWDKFGGKECNNGFCDIFAKNLSKYLPGSTIMSTEDPRNETLGHVWVEYNGKYFDAETPNGVSSWKELPWMKEFYSKVGNYPTNIENINESIVGDKIECDNCDWSWPIKDGGDDLYVCHKCGHDNTPKQLNEGRYDKITNDISSAIFNKWKQDYEEGADESRLDQTFETDDLSIDIDANISFTPGTGKLSVDGGADAETGYLEVRFEIDPKKLPDFWSEISMNLKDVVRHEIEHLTHGEGYNENPSKLLPDDQFIRDMIDADMLPKAAYFKLEKEIDANLQGMYLRAKKEKRPFGDVINSYLDAQEITPEEKKEILDIWRGRLKALNLPKF